MYRDTYAEINLKEIEYNVKFIIHKYNNFKYYFDAVKVNGYSVLEIADSIISEK